eukprot:COSAG05_NODE_4443_length_1512_cov_5.246285_2_plen_174_part_00
MNLPKGPPLGFGEICVDLWDFERGGPEVVFLLLLFSQWAVVGNCTGRRYCLRRYYVASYVAATFPPVCVCKSKIYCNRVKSRHDFLGETDQTAIYFRGPTGWESHAALGRPRHRRCWARIRIDLPPSTTIYHYHANSAVPPPPSLSSCVRCTATPSPASERAFPMTSSVIRSP